VRIVFLDALGSAGGHERRNWLPWEEAEGVPREGEYVELDPVGDGERAGGIRVTGVLWTFGGRIALVRVDSR
jgi:hypothetical protein